MCPGSRNSPLTETALATPQLRCKSIYDERGAGFFALGLARASERPVLVLCTSGSAGAHFLPALIEARYAGLGLVLLTADRPFELQQSGGAQTIDQADLFGRYAETGPALPEPSADPDKLRALFGLAARAARGASGPTARSFHLNVPLKKPLELAAAESPAEQQLAATVERLCAQPVANFCTASEPSMSAATGFLQGFLAAGRRPLITLGPVSAPQAALARQLASQLQVPLLSEFAQGGAAAPLDGMCQNWNRTDAAQGPSQVLHVGPPALSSACATLFRSERVKLWCVPGNQVGEPTHRAVDLQLGALLPQLETLLRAASQMPPVSFEEAGDWKELRSALCSDLQHACENCAREAPLDSPAELARSGGHKWSEVDAVRSWLKAATSAKNSASPKRLSRTLFLGNSLAVRLVAWLSPLLDEQAVAAGHPFITTRGASGIDGSIAAASAAAWDSGAPTVALLGDVTAAHDIGSLALAQSLQTPLVLCVLNNGGGHIFDHLPVSRGAIAETHFEYWTTPPRISFVDVAHGYGIASGRADDRASFAEHFEAAIAEPGATLIELQVRPDSTRFAELLRDKR